MCIVREIKFLVVGQKIATLRQNFNVKLRELLMFDKKFVIKTKKIEKKRKNQKLRFSQLIHIISKNRSVTLLVSY